ncbi:COG3650 family protein [Desertivirga brevis]|uniref:COG3650 family protein n=1 Tax=Desertivirga brevis TaxID=2810310 RepID=UPI001A973FEC|nr:hypothetical protein [Pedobacter sp. SYSU D00873]
MKYLQHFYPLIAISIISCTSNPNPPGTIAALNIPNDTTDTATTVKSSITTEEFSGRYYPSQDSDFFVVCSGVEVILRDENMLLKSNYQKNQVALSYPGESVTAKISGRLRKGSAKGIRDTIVVAEVKEVKPKSFETDCYNYEFIGIGTEPFWSLEIIPDENTIAIKDVSVSKAYKFSYQKPRITNNTYVYKTGDGQEIAEITIRKESCNDGMSDRDYKYSVMLVINGKPLSGCAIKKGDKL